MTQRIKRRNVCFCTPLSCLQHQYILNVNAAEKKQVINGFPPGRDQNVISLKPPQEERS